MFFLNPKFQNLSPIMQCKREQMGKSYVGKGFGGPRGREIWLPNVSHTNVQLPPGPPQDALRMEPGWGSGGAGRLQGGGTLTEQSLYLCFLENMNKEHNSSATNKRDQSKGQPGKWLAVTTLPSLPPSPAPAPPPLEFPKCSPIINKLYALAFLKVSIQAFSPSMSYSSRKALPAYMHDVTFQQVFLILTGCPCVH